MTHRPLTRLLLAAALGLLILAVGARPARAATFTISSCTAAQSTPAPWFPERSMPWLIEQDSCRYVDGMSVWASYALGGMVLGQWGRWRFTVPGDLRIRRVRGTVRFKQRGGFATGMFDEANGGQWLSGGPGCVGVCEAVSWAPFDRWGLDTQAIELLMYCVALDCPP